MYRTISIVLAMSLLSGCVGLAVGTYGKKEWVRTEFSLAKERNKFSFEEREARYTETEIIDHWGEPDAVESYQECKVLVYKDGTSWAGAGAFVGVVPVPLAVPTGSYKNRFYLQQQQAVGLVQEYGDVGRMAGYTCGSNECGTTTGEKVNEPEIDAEEAMSQWCASA